MTLIIQCNNNKNDDDFMLPSAGRFGGIGNGIGIGITIGWYCWDHPA